MSNTCVLLMIGMLLCVSWTHSSSLDTFELREELRALEEEDVAIQEQLRETKEALLAKQQEADDTPTVLDEREEITDIDSKNNCPSCGKASVCCRAGDAFTCCPKIYVGDEMRVEIDTKKNIVTYYMDDTGVRILDFSKGLISTYDPKANVCHLVAGIDFTLDDVIDAAEKKASKANKANQAHYYNPMNVKPLKDLSLLPDALREKCTGKPIYWDERVSTEKGLSVRDHTIEKRWCICCCWNCC